jgi:hypothetical protein
MDESSKAADAADSKTADDRAAEALANLEALLKKKNGICAMCRGGGEQPFPWPEDLAQTLEQLMQALIPKPGSGGEGDKPGFGGGGRGFSGNSESGFAMKGHMPRLPIYGPSRNKFARSNAGPGRTGDGQGRGQGAPERGADVGADQLTIKSRRGFEGDALAPEAVPEPYREAVKRYFSHEENPPASRRP